MTDTPNTSDADLRLAYHEAGHCVAALVYGITVRYVTITPSKSAQGEARSGHASIRRPKTPPSAEQRKGEIYGDLKSMHATLIRCLAGPVCESRFTRRPVDVVSMAGDFVAAVEIIRTCLGENATPAMLENSLNQVVLDTQEVFRNPKTWRAVQRIADELVVWRRLAGGEVRRLFLQAINADG
jgi:hypothetical protein